jgi:hypothetical protein
MPGERMGMFTGNVKSRTAYNANSTGYGHLLDSKTVLDCTDLAYYYCLPSHCNDYRGVRNKFTGELGEINCELVHCDGDEIWIVSTRKIVPGPRGYAELLTYYGVEFDELNAV